jgi:lathosterol oxidase
MEPLIADLWQGALAFAGLEGARLWAALVTVSMLGGLVIYFGFGGLLYLRYYVLRRDDAAAWKLQARRFTPRKLHRWATSVAAGNLAIGGLLSGSYAYAISQGGPTALYLDVGEYGWTYTILSTVIGFVLLEAAAYYTHRALHGKWLFRHVHRWHHRVVAPTPFTTTTMHPAEFLAFQATAFLPTFFVPLWAGSFIGLLVYVLIFNIMDHSGIEIHHSLPWQSSSRYHDDHHVHFHCNYGQNLMLFDRFHGTLRRKDRRYGKEVFGGRGAPAEGETAPDGGDPFVDYS